MRCMYHPDSPAQALCQTCQKGLCARCATAYKVDGCCPDCHVTLIRELRSTAIGGLIKGCVLGLVLAMLTVLNGHGGGRIGSFVVFFYVGLALYWGRHTLQRLTKRWGGVALLVGAALTSEPGLWAFAGALFGVFLWGLIGFFSAPVEICLAILRLVHLKEVDAQVRITRSQLGTVGS
jgi:hypothetical protein